MEENLKKEVATLIAESVKPVTDQVGQLAEAVKPVTALVKSVEDLTTNVETVADTLSQLPPAAAKDAGKEDGKPKALTLEDLTKVLDARDQAKAGDASKAQAKAALRDKVIAAKLPGVPKSVLAALPDTEDEAALTTAADALRKDLDAAGIKPADTKGAGGDGGKTAEQAQAEKAAGTGFLKMPGAPAATATA
jgi:hypothetical protein